MKKLFIAAMALATIVSCSKDEAGDAVLTSSKKSVEITISNYKSATRAISNPTDGEVTANSKVGTIESPVATDNTIEAANVNQLMVLFANNANTILHAFPLSAEYGANGKYTYHSVSESVTQFAVVRNVTVTKNGESVSYSYNLDKTTFEGQKLDTYKTNALVEYTDNRGIEFMDLFVASGQLTNPKTCTVDAEDHTGYEAGYTYKLYSASVEVAPMLARVELEGVACDGGDDATKALGATTLASFNGDPVSGGFDELKLGTIKFGTAAAVKSYDFDDFVLKGIYEKGVGQRNATAYTPGENKVIAWNIATSTAFPLVETNPMTIDMVASAYDYTVVNTAKQLTIGFDNATTKAFEPGKIYRFSINFGEDNLDKSNEAICVEVNVTIANWEVVGIDPVFGN